MMNRALLFQITVSAGVVASVILLPFPVDAVIVFLGLLVFNLPYVVGNMDTQNKRILREYITSFHKLERWKFNPWVFLFQIAVATGMVASERLLPFPVDAVIFVLGLVLLYAPSYVMSVMGEPDNEQ